MLPRGSSVGIAASLVHGIAASLASPHLCERNCDDGREQNGGISGR